MTTTIILPVSRKDYLSKIFIILEMLDCDRAYTNLLVYVDGSLELFQKVRNLVVNSKFRERLCVYRRKGVGSVSSVLRRRQRIADIHNEIKDLIKETDFIFLIEDDTLFPSNTLKKLLSIAYMKKYFGFISGVEVGRWGLTHIGGWIVDDIYDTKQVTSIKKGTGVVEVDGAGLYCCLTTKENYMKNIFKPYDKILGPDFDFGITLRKKGLKNYLDYSITCQHLTKKEALTLLNSKIVQVRFEKSDDDWRMKILEDN